VSDEASTALAAEVAGKAWLITLGAKGASTPGGTKVRRLALCPPSPPRSISCVSVRVPAALQTANSQPQIVRTDKDTIALVPRLTTHYPDAVMKVLRANL
jgi:hypothetical protein